MFCNDPFLSYLKSSGYNVIRLPKADVKPLQVLTRQGNELHRLGELANLLVAGSFIALPQLSENTQLANISGKRTSDLSMGVGLSIITSIISAMGGTGFGLDTKYQQAKTIAFEFQDVYEDKIDVIKLDQYLANADVNPFSRYVAQLLEADDLLVTTATVKSTKILVEAKRSNGAALDLSIPEIQEIVGGSIKISGQASVSSKITYETPVPLVFGFQAVRLFYDQGRYTAFEPLKAGGIAMRSFDEPAADGTQRLMTDSAFVRLTNV